MLHSSDWQHARWATILAASIGLLALLTARGSAATEYQLTIEARHDLPAGPVSLQLPAALHGAPLRLADADSGRAVAIQSLGSNGKRAVFIADPLAAGQSRRYRLSAATAAPSGDAQRPAAAHRVVVDQDDRRLRVSVGGRPVLQYNTATVEAPEGIPAYFRRSGYLHPVYDPAGRVVTGDFAADHAHQHGIFMAWVNTMFDGKAADFWNQAKQSARIAHLQLQHHRSGDVFAEFRAILTHTVPMPDADQAAAEPAHQPVLRETWTVRIYDTASDDPAAPFLFDVRSVQRCVAQQPLMLREYHYGGMAVRGTTDWLGHPEHGFLTSEGQGAAEGNHSRPRWVDMYGPIDGRLSGIAVLGHPQNFRFPQPVRLHPSKPYFCFAPMVLGSFSISPGEDYVSRYRFVVHNGGSDPGQLRQLWQAYADPPRLTVSEVPSPE